MRKQKILILSWRGPGHPNAGGAELSTHEHAKAWVKAGHSVTLFTSYFKGGKKKEFIDGVKIIRKGSDIFGVQILAFIWYVFRKHAKFDLVVDQFHGIPFFTPLYIRTKKLAFIHEVAKEVWWFNPWPKPFNLIPAIIGTIFERFIFTILYRKIPFMTVSESTKKDLVRWGIPKGNITVVYNGVSVVNIKVQKENRNTVIYLGALTKDKGIEDAIEVFGLINRRDPDWQFWVVGKGDTKYLGYLNKKIKELNLGKKVKFWGFVDQKKKFELLTKAHVLINSSIREGWGLVNIEANATGTPVVGYNVQGIKDSVVSGKTGLLSRPGSCEDLAENAIKLCDNVNLYSAMRKEATTWAKRFTWEKSTRESLNLINALVALDFITR
jgi:glycosyltransferase involved in cell wall biosynthesis